MKAKTFNLSSWFWDGKGNYKEMKGESNMDVMMKELQKKEALTRLRMLKVQPMVLRQFSSKKVVYQSDRIKLEQLHDDYMDIIKKWEEDTGDLVYFVLHDRMEEGECLSLLYVNQEKEFWSLDRKALENDIATPDVYVKNFDNDSLSGITCIGIYSLYGTMIRVA